MKFKVKRPCGHNVLVKLRHVEEVSKGGIVLASTEKEKKRQQAGTEVAYVQALGSSAYKGFDDGSPWCAVGDTVLIKKYSGADMEYNSEFYRVILDDDVMAVLEEEEDNE